MDKGQANLRNVTREINRIVSAPYMVLFKTLSLLLNTVDDNQIDLWAHIKECQTAALVTRIIDALSHDASALSVLSRLIRNCTIRDEFIRQNPMLLGTFFSSTSDDRIWKIAMILCRHPFPESFALPPEYFDFANSILRNDHGAPLQSWIKDAYVILLSMQSAVVATIDDETVQKCTALWNEASKVSDNSVFVKFMAIAAIVHGTHSNHDLSVSHGSTIDLQGSAIALWASKCSRMFLGERLPKIIKSLLLRALFFVSKKPGEFDGEETEFLTAIKQCLSAVGSNSFAAMITDRDTSSILTKFAHKIVQASTPIELRLRAFSVLLLLDPTCRYWDVSLLLDTFKHLLYDQLQTTGHSTGIRPGTLPNLKLQHYLSELLQDLSAAGFLDGPLLSDILQLSIDWCRPGMYPTLEMMCCLRYANSCVDIIRNFVKNNNLSDKIAKYFASMEIPDWWNWNIASPDKPSSCCNLDICHRAKDNLQRDLAACISGTLIMVTCSSSSNLARDKYCKLWDVSCTMKANTLDSSCQWPQASASRKHSQFAFEDDHARKDVSSEQRLCETLASINQHTSHIVQEHIDSICRDLQRRCEDVEGPLAAERTKSSILRKELLESRSAQEVLLADHEARRVSWQHQLEVEQEETTNLKNGQDDMKRMLETLAQQLTNEERKVAIAEQARMELQSLCETLREQLEQEKTRSQSHKENLEQASNENKDLLERMQIAQEKEQKMMCVLRGGTSLA